MEFVHVVWYYIFWHYTKAWKDLLRVIDNYLWFIGNYFSINLLLGTLFSPWRRLKISGGRGQADGFFAALLINTLMRLVGFIFRLFVILSGACAILITLFLGFVAIVLWLVLPLVVFMLFFAGVGYITKSLL
jgi:hypothetical protein